MKVEPMLLKLSKANFNQLYVFARVATVMNMSKVAEELDMSKSAISRNLKTLENVIGVTLIERTTRKMRLTVEGDELFQEINPHILGLESVLNQLSQKGQFGRSGTVKIACSIELSEYLLLNIVPLFRKKHPDIDIQIEATPEVKDPVKDNFDAVVRIGEVKDSAYYYRPITTIRAKVYASRLFAEELSNHNYAVENVPWLVSDRYRIKGRETVVPVLIGKEPKMLHLTNIHTRIKSLSVRKNLAIQGSGVTLLPSFIIQHEIQQGQLVRVFPALESQNIPIGFLYGGRKLLPHRLNVFLNFVCDY
ncbi:LysR family transcriptional regulator, partial [Pseudoalteromonas shioyasakiensis]|uniref:LysR family transcriptional regulator n=1 Tax=Pseudoalteromonas shioyasakiensis TaxID=1190813 RepID=UPI001EFEB76F